MWKNIFSFEGRIRRTEYGATFLIFIFGRAVLNLLIAGIFVASESENFGGMTVTSILLSIPFLWFLWAQGAKRCHDMGKSGWWQLIPFFPLVMIFKEGDSHTNEYGDNPKGNRFNNVSGPINAPTIAGNTIRTGSYNGGHNAGSGVNTSQTSNFNTVQGNGTPRPSQPNSSQSGSYKSGDLYK
jgi:uncharacterized membrane protein YhaH (DUF805 family)